MIDSALPPYRQLPSVRQLLNDLDRRRSKEGTSKSKLHAAKVFLVGCWKDEALESVEALYRGIDRGTSVHLVSNPLYEMASSPNQEVRI